MERLQKIIANNGYTSRRKAEQLIVDGKVKVNDVVITELGCKVKVSSKIEVEGTLITKEEKEYFLLYKPEGVISSVSDEKNRRTVVDLVLTNSRIYPVGRLDYDTSGAIILTNDGELTNKLLHPSRQIDKTYTVKVEGIIDGYSVKRLREGVVIDNKKTSKAEVKVKRINRSNRTSFVQVTIHEGFNHQIKKMFEVVGFEVSKLKRISFADLTLDGLKKGDARRLTTKEVKVLYSKVKD